MSYEQRVEVSLAKVPSIAKKIAGKYPYRPDWESVKFKIMEDLVRQKFHNPHLKSALLSTGNNELVNTGTDPLWGVPKSGGKNILGKILMAIRKEYVEELEFATSGGRNYSSFDSGFKEEETTNAQ